MAYYDPETGLIFQHKVRNQYGSELCWVGHTAEDLPVIADEIDCSQLVHNPVDRFRRRRHRETASGSQ